MYLILSNRFNTCAPFQRTFISNSNNGSITRKDKEDQEPVIATIKKVSFLHYLFKLFINRLVIIGIEGGYLHNSQYFNIW